MSTISQRQIQKLFQKLSPQQIQMIKLLELPAMQLEARIKQEIEENPVLEETVEKNVDSDGQPTKYNIEEYIKNDDIPSYKLYANNYSKDDKFGTVPLSAGLSYREYLEEQLSFQGLSERASLVGSYIIGSLDSDGYLRRELLSLADDISFSTGLDVSEAEVEEGLNIIQSFEPYGTGARSLQEALLLQLKHHPQSHPVKIATRILEHYFADFAKKHYDKIIARMVY